MSSLKDVGERQLIKNIRKVIRPAASVQGTEDDAAVLRSKGDTVVCSDIVTFERHRPEGMTSEQFGWTAAAVNFSDLAAMGAKPTGIIVSLAMPDEMDESELYDMMSGIDQCAEYCDTAVIGGDTKPGPGVISCTAIGDMEGRRPMMRSGANPGDVIAITGALGGPAAGFAALKNGIDAEDAIFSLMTPVPMIKEGIALSGCGKISSCIDLSDGLATAANTICEQSRCGMEIVCIDPKGRVERILLGPNLEKGERMMAAIPSGVIFGARNLDSSGYTFVSCATAPKFTYAGFRMVHRAEMEKLCPAELPGFLQMIQTD